jgi:hypothetical protein
MSGAPEQELRAPADRTATFRLRLYAANLPLCGRGPLKRLPDTYARIVTNSNLSRMSTTQPIVSPLNVYGTSNNSRNMSNSSTSLHYNKLGETEIIRQCQSPQWTETVLLEYEYGTEYHFTVHVLQQIQQSSSTTAVSLGSALFEVGDILGTKNRMIKVKRLRTGGCIFCLLEPVQVDNLEVSASFIIKARSLVPPHGKSRGVIRFFHTSHPDTVLEIAKRPRTLSGGNSIHAWVTVYRSQPVVNASAPCFDAIHMNVGTLCNGDAHRHLRFSILAVKKNHPDTLIGMAETTLHHLLTTTPTKQQQQQDTSSSAAELALTEHAVESSGEHTIIEHTDDDRSAESSLHPDASPETAVHELLLQRNSSKLKEVGRLQICRAEVISPQDDKSQEWIRMHAQDDSEQEQQAEIVEVVDLSTLSPVAAPTLNHFQAYMERGCQIDFCVAIDFTSSNGDPREEGSLHYQGCDDALNDYEETITVIGQALAAYNADQNYCVWGFGAKFDGVVRHLFQCGPSPTVTGVSGILAAYESIFQTGVTMSGPTVIEQVIQAAAVRARNSHQTMTRESLRYTVLLIITDGIMDDLPETQRKLAVYSEMPLSVIVVGVGRSDFGLMYQLCHVPANSTTRPTTTFTEFRRHQHDPSALAEAALRRIPKQLCEYMELRGF